MRFWMVTLGLLVGLIGPVLAQGLTPDMIERFKSLPRAQQEALAKQYGIDLSEIQGGGLESMLGVPGERLEQKEPDSLSETDEGLREIIGFRPELKRYGLDLFDAQVSTFAPTDDAPVPDNYLLGPGDQLIVQLFGGRNEEVNLEVSRAGSVNFPELGPITVAGLRFEDARNLIAERIRKQLVGVEGVISMGRLRAINVFMAGEVKVPGAYSVSALTTVTQALFVAGGPNETGSMRQIAVKRGGETVAIFDLYDLLIRGDARNDIRLQSGDVIFVPVYGSLMEVDGAVKRPAVFELRPGEGVADVIGFAGGLRPEANGREASLRVTAGDGALNQILDVASAQGVDISAGGYLLVPVAAQFFESRNQLISQRQEAIAIKVSIEGEVEFPGVYYVTSGERLSDLVRRAGGVRENGSLNGAVFTRESVRARERLRARELADMVRGSFTSSLMTSENRNFDIETIDFVTEELKDYDGIGRFVIDLPRALGGREDADIRLMEGDALYIPPATDIVSVFGEVRRASSHGYQANFDVDDYLKLAAGVTERGDESNIYIVKANGSVVLPETHLFSFMGNSQLAPGDTIIVPIDGSYKDALPFWRDVISIVYQGAVAVAAINGL